MAFREFCCCCVQAAAAAHDAHAEGDDHDDGFGGAVHDSRADVPALCYGKRPDRLLLLIQQLKQLKRELGRGPLRPGGGPGPGPGPRDGGRRRLKQEDTTPREDEASTLEESIPSVTSPFPCMIYPNGVRACGVIVEARVSTTILSRSCRDSSASPPAEAGAGCPLTCSRFRLPGQPDPLRTA
mgnify:CR=1 FL=1